MATQGFLRASLVFSVGAFVFMFIAFASPYWYKSWTRVHSSFGNIGLWHICLNGFIRPRDPIMKSYVGCWWIHSSEFSIIKDEIQPVWFRFIQAFSIFALVADLLAMIFTLLYMVDSARVKLYKRRPRMFFISSMLLMASAFLVFLISLVFAEMSHDSSWMPRPWMNYLSWSFGLCVLSGFFAAFGGMCLFILALIFKEKEDNGDPGVTSAAQLAAKHRALEKQDEAMRSQPGMLMETKAPYDEYGSGTVHRPQYHHKPAYQEKSAYYDKSAYQDKPDTGAGSVTGSSSTRVGESFV